MIALIAALIAGVGYLILAGLLFAFLYLMDRYSRRYQEGQSARPTVQPPIFEPERFHEPAPMERDMWCQPQPVVGPDGSGVDTTRTDPGGRPKYKIPGIWTAYELYALLNEQLGLGYDLTTFEGKNCLKAWFYYVVQKGLIPEGQERIPLDEGTQTGECMQLWTDSQVRDILATLPHTIIPPPE